MENQCRLWTKKPLRGKKNHPCLEWHDKL
jgi:hypothetical protein